MSFIKLSLVFSAAILFAACSGANVSQNTASAPANSATNNSTTAQNPAGDSELAIARGLYSKRCVSCHKENGEGGEKDIEGEKIKVPNFKDPRVAAENDEEYIHQIEKGGDGMPAYKGKITDGEIKNLVLYIRKEFQGK
jgi:mono/diheme cytochrome c family protein